MVPLILGFMLGFAAYLYLPTYLTFSNVQQASLPISLKLLQNRLIYEWRGSVKGQILSIGANSFTISDGKGASVIVSTTMPSGDAFATKFYEKGSSPSASSSAFPSWKEIPFDRLQVGDKIYGEFFIFKGGKDKPVGSAFWVEK